MCKKKCGIHIDKEKVIEEERTAVRELANGADYWIVCKKKLSHPILTLPRCVLVPQCIRQKS